MSRKNSYYQKEYSNSIPLDTLNTVCTVDEDTLKTVDEFVKEHFEEPKKEVVVSCNNLLNVRTSPELGSFKNVKCRVTNGTHLEFVDEIGDWYKVRLSGLPNNVDSIGYILKEFAIIV